MDAQRTLKRQISCAGIGLHSGTEGHADAQARAGRHRHSCSAAPTWASRFPPRSSTCRASSTPRCSARTAPRSKPSSTCWPRSSAPASTTSSSSSTSTKCRSWTAARAPFLFCCRKRASSGCRRRARYLKMLQPVQIANGDKRIAIYPSDHFKVSYTISFDHPLLRHQSRTERITEQSFAETSPRRAPSAS